MFHLFVELGIILLFIFNIYIAKKTKKLDLLIIATVFAALFENLHVILFQNQVGGYYYSEQFLLFIYKTPLFVILSWGIIILNAYLIATKLTNKVGRIFLTPILVLLVDFALEFFAVKQGYWTWIGYDATQGLFGVPASNFISWMLITLALVFCYDELEEKWAVPIVAYILFVLIATGEAFIVDMLGIDPSQYTYLIWFIIISMLIATLALWKLKQKEEIKTKYLTLAVLSRAAYYIFALILVFSNAELSRTIWPIIIYVFLIEAAIIIAVYYKKRKIKFVSSFSS
ncbi:MAG: carotenoid biosynthesis protein [archaeon]